MDLRNVRVLILAVAAVTVLSACIPTFAITEPKDGATVKLPAKTTVSVRATPSMSSAHVKLDGTYVTNQLNWVPSANQNLDVLQGDLSVPVGKHTITAEADVYCWWCPNHSDWNSAQTTFCVAWATWPAVLPTSTAFAKGDSLSWTKTSDTTVGVAADAGTPTTRWRLSRIHILQAIGTIQSTENGCLCMRSMSGVSGTPIGLAICDENDPLQQWEAFLMPNTNNHYRIQNLNRGSQCLTEGPNGVLIESGCLDTDKQLWRTKDNGIGLWVPPF